MTAAAREQNRRLLLAEMGIQCLFPRGRLPGAGSSHQQIFLPVREPTAVDAGGVTDTEQRRNGPTAPDQKPQAKSDGLSMTRQVLQATTAETRTAAEHTRPTAPADQIPAAAHAGPVEPEPIAQPAIEEQEPFAFSWFTLDYRLAVLVMLPEGQSRLSASSRDMLQKILAALCQDYRNQPLSEHSFHWPLPDDLGLPADRDAAMHTVRGFIARRMREQTVANVLVLGDQPPFFLGGQESRRAAGLYTDEQFGFSVLCTHALHSMQQQPALKRSAWQAMQILIPRL